MATKLAIGRVLSSNNRHDDSGEQDPSSVCSHQSDRDLSLRILEGSTIVHTRRNCTRIPREKRIARRVCWDCPSDANRKVILPEHIGQDYTSTLKQARGRESTILGTIAAREETC